MQQAHHHHHRHHHSSHSHEKGLTKDERARRRHKRLVSRFVNYVFVFMCLLAVLVVIAVVFSFIIDH